MGLTSASVRFFTSLSGFFIRSVCSKLNRGSIISDKREGREFPNLRKKLCIEGVLSFFDFVPEGKKKVAVFQSKKIYFVCMAGYII